MRHYNHCAHGCLLPRDLNAVSATSFALPYVCGFLTQKILSWNLIKEGSSTIRCYKSECHLRVSYE